jgi:hypothetical protein
MTNLLDPEKVDMFGSRSILAYNWFEHKYEMSAGPFNL